jgi:hypothetical protein
MINAASLYLSSNISHPDNVPVMFLVEDWREVGHTTRSRRLKLSDNGKIPKSLIQ